MTMTNDTPPQDTCPTSTGKARADRSADMITALGISGTNGVISYFLQTHGIVPLPSPAVVLAVESGVDYFLNASQKFDRRLQNKMGSAALRTSAAPHWHRLHRTNIDRG